MEHSTSASGLIVPVFMEKGKGLDWVKTQIDQLSALPNPTAAQMTMLQSLKDLKAELEAIMVGFSLWS